MKKILVLFLILFVSSIGFSLEKESWIRWLDDRNWVIENNVEIPIYDSINLYVIDESWELIQSGEYNFLSVTVIFHKC